MDRKGHTNFSGTYFDKDAVMRLERWVRVIAWAVMAAYVYEAGNNVFQSLSSAAVNDYPVDYAYLFMGLFPVLRGAALFALLQVAAKVLLILLDIEDNTRRAARS